MCKIGGKARKKDQVMRVLTLICFFHFSGLNNGFAYLADASGAADGAGFAPYFVTGCAKVLNPLNWKRTALDSLRQFGFTVPPASSATPPAAPSRTCLWSPPFSSSGSPSPA